MSGHTVGTRQEWLAARRELLVQEKEHTRRGDELARRRQELPWVRVDKEYRFHSESGPVSLPELFAGRSQLLVYHLMSPDCPSCASLVDGVNGSLVHLENHDVTLIGVCRSPIEELAAFRRRMGWQVPLVSSAGSDFNYDFHVSFTEDQLSAGAEYNFTTLPPMQPGNAPENLPGMSAFALAGGEVFHTYSAYARGGDALWGVYQWLDRAPLGRNETGAWFRLRDEYPSG